MENSAEHLEGSTPKELHHHLTVLAFPFFTSAGLAGQDKDIGWGLKFPHPV